MATMHIDNDIKRFERILNRQVTFEVERYINNAIKPTVDRLVCTLAAEATKNWTQHIKVELDSMQMEKRIQINFVEHIVKTVMKDNDISIEVNKND